MPGTMSRADLVGDLKTSLHDAASVFTSPADADFERMIDLAALAFSRIRPRTLLGSVTVTAGTALYAAPEGILAYKSDAWSDGKMPSPWEPNYPGRLPSVRLIEDAGTKKLAFTPAPTALQIGLFGAAFPFYYLAAHVVATSASGTSISAGDRDLLILRAQVEAMRELAMRNLGKPVQMRDGLSGMTRNGTPSYLYETLLAEFERRA